MRVSAALLLALLAGCDRPEPTVIDGSSQQAFERSVKQARRDVPDADRLYFDRALRTVGGRLHSARDPQKFARTTFDGMTGEDVVADQKAREGLR